MIHRTLTWTTGSLTRAQMLIHAIAQGVGGRGTYTVRESALIIDPERKKEKTTTLAAPGNRLCVSGVLVRLCTTELYPHLY